MKKFTFMMIALLCVVVTFAALSGKQSESPIKFLQKSEIVKKQPTLKMKALDRKALPARNRVMKAAELVTLPEEATAETFYTASGSFYAGTESGWSDATSYMSSVNVAVVGTDIYVQGLSYWFKEGWIKGALDGTTATFPNGQLVGSDSEGDEFIVGSEDGETLCDIVFTYNAEDGVLAAVTPFIMESASADEAQVYCYWQQPTFTKEEPATPEVVVAPAGLETEEYVMTYSDYYDESGSASVKVGFDGDDVYFQGLSSYLPEAWVKGTLADGVVTLAGGQYFGAYGSYEMYLMDEDYQFTYDAESSVFVGDGLLYTYTGNQYTGYYNNPVLKKVVEKAAVPAAPAITALTNSNYGWYVSFNVPLVDENGDGLVSSKLSYIIYTDIEGEIAPLTFTPATHNLLTEDLTEIPFGFTEDYDFYDTQIYLNGLYSEDWNNIGIQSIYRGGDEENATEIQWYHIKDYAGPVTPTESFVWVAAEQGYENSTAVTEFVIAKDDEDSPIVTGLADKAEGKSEPKYYSTGESLRLYASNTLTVTSQKPMVKIVFTFDTTKDPAFDVTTGTFEVANGIGTWTGEATEVVFTVPSLTGAQTRIQKIEVFYESEGDEPVEPVIEDDVLVTLPEGVESEDYTLAITQYAYSSTSGWVSVSSEETAQVAFDGNDIYVSGLAYFFKDAFVKGTLNEEGQVVFKSGQLVGEDEYGKEYLVGAITEGEEDVISDFAFDYDAEARTLTLVEGYTLLETESPTNMGAYTFTEAAVYTPGAFVLPDVVELPEGVEAETWYLAASTESGNINGTEVSVAFDGNDIYVQGLCSYLPEAWVKGTIEGGKATFASGQFYGTYYEQYNLFFVGFDDDQNIIDFVFDYDAEAGTLTNYDQYIALNGKQNELSMYDYMYNIEITREQPAGPVEAPEGLQTETYLFSALQLVNPEEDAARRAEGEDVAAGNAVTFDFNAMDVAVSTNDATDGDITETLVLTEGDVTLSVSPKAETATTENRFWGTNNGPQLRVYSGTLTFEVPEGMTMTQIVFNNGRWNANTTADKGEFDGATWTGEAQTLVVTIGGNTQLNNIVVTLEGENGEEPGLDPDADWAAYANQVQVGFDGDDAYIQGIVADCPELWVKATKNETGQYVIPANQYMGTYDVGGIGWFVYDYYFTAVDEEGNLTDVVLDYDAEAQAFTTNQILATNGDRKILYYYELFKDVTIAKMQEFAATPADPSVKGLNLDGNYPNVQFDIPTVDVDGNELLASKLSYQILIFKDGEVLPLTLAADLYDALDEDMTEIPYTFGDDYDILKGGARVYLNQGAEEIATWTNIGVQSIYYGGGECNKSETVWYDDVPTGIAEVKTDGKTVVIYDLQGRRVAKTAKGLYIMDGKKVVIK